VRPNGQYRDEEGKVVFGATKRLDYELEVAAVIGKPSVLGEPVAIENADEYIFGCVLLNDWSGKLASCGNFISQSLNFAGRC
jgi:fumarylacetoacetase